MGSTSFGAEGRSLGRNASHRPGEEPEAVATVLREMVDEALAELSTDGLQTEGVRDATRRKQTPWPGYRP
jgi:hypothetical protein